MKHARRVDLVAAPAEQTAAAVDDAAPKAPKALKPANAANPAKARGAGSVEQDGAVDTTADPLVEIWSDGACRGNPGPGGWGALLRSGAHEKELFGGELNTTNNRMELMAVIQALGALKRASPVLVHTDSQYVMQGITTWMPNWIRRGWKTADNKPVKNVDLWQSLSDAVSQHQVRWRWVRGHAGDPGNERADQLANRGVDSVLAAVREAAASARS